MRKQRSILSVALLATVLVAGCSQAQDLVLPGAIGALEGKGLSKVQEFEVGKGVRGFAGVAGDRPVAIYVTADGTTIVGMRVGEDGASLDEARLQELVAKPLAEQTWAQLKAASWVQDGRSDAPRVLYTFSDPNCPYCHRFWEAARPWVDAGKVQVRHLLVGVIKADSANKAAAILESADPGAALQENERNAGAGGIAPVTNISASSRNILDANQQLMLALGFRGTPGIVVRGEDGSLKKYNGLPQAEALNDVLGPR